MGTESFRNLRQLLDPVTVMSSGCVGVAVGVAVGVGFGVGVGVGVEGPSWEYAATATPVHMIIMTATKPIILVFTFLPL